MKSNVKFSKENIKKQKIVKYVIDASVCGTDLFKERISEIIKNNDEVIILTSVTVKELVKLEKISDCTGMDAKYIIGIAAENEEKFINVLIDENFDKPDDAIINYCNEQNNSGLVLITSDREMTLNARMRGVTVEYIKQTSKFNNTRHQVINYNQNYNYKNVIHPNITNKNYNNENNYRHDLSKKTPVLKKLTNESEVKDNNCLTLKDIFILNRKPNVMCYAKYDKALCVYSNGVMYSKGLKEIKIGDEVLIAKRHEQEGYVTFSSFKIVSLKNSNNAVLKSSKRIYEGSLINLPDKRHIEFVKNFLN